MTPGNQDAEWARVMLIVSPEAVIPEIWWLLMYALIPATVGVALAKPWQKAA